MGKDFDTFLTLDDALNARYRGHQDRDWNEWRERHHFASAEDIPGDAHRAWLNREKLNYRGLRTRQTLTHLVAGGVDQPFLDEIGDLAGLERLELEWPFVGTDLTPLLRLQRLRHLSIDSPRKIKDFSILLGLPSLRTLLLTNAKGMPDLQWLSDAHQLEVLGIEGAIDAPYKIESVVPLAGLRSLRAFLGISTRLADRNLMPFARCPNLQYLGIARCAGRADFEALRHSRPDIVCRWFDERSWQKPVLKAAR